MEKKHEAREAYEKAVSLGVPRMELMEKLKKRKQLKNNNLSVCRNFA